MLKISHSVAHYLLVIHELKEKRGYARITDIARELNLTKGSVSTAVTKLKARGLVVEDEGVKFISLTDKGHQAVHSILASRSLIYNFLVEQLGVPASVAIMDACSMEHLLSVESQQALFKFLRGTWKELDKFQDFAEFVQEQGASFEAIGDVNDTE
jgi:DtxR family Mn-dependent transcriptional regulator